MDKKKKYELFAKNRNFCVLPWTGFELFTDGKVKTCSLGKTTLGNVNSKPLQEILQGNEIKSIRKNMLENKPDSNCVMCQSRHIDDLKFNYLRDHYNAKAINDEVDYMDTDNFQLRFLDLHWSNICNLKCVMCDADQSSMIAKEQNIKHTPVNHDTITEILRWVKEEQEQLKEIYLSGGEPFYIPQNITLLKSITNKDLPLRINTNMHWSRDNRLFKELKNFRNVQLTMSVDAVGEKFNYIRNGGNWKKFIENFTYIKHNTNFDIRVNMIFSVLNAVDVPENINFFLNENITNITINQLVNPVELAPWNYPAEKKSAIMVRLSDLFDNISEQQKNLRAQIKLCMDNISKDATHSYLDKMDEVAKRYDKPWREVHTDI